MNDKMLKLGQLTFVKGSFVGLVGPQSVKLGLSLLLDNSASLLEMGAEKAEGGAFAFALRADAVDERGLVRELVLASSLVGLLLEGCNTDAASLTAICEVSTAAFSFAFLTRVARSGLLAVPGERKIERRFALIAPSLSSDMAWANGGDIEDACGCES